MTDLHVNEAIEILKVLGLPKRQLNERSALSLLALANLAPGEKWAQASNPSIGVTPLMEWIHEKYLKEYKPNTRESIRRRTMHQFVAAGLVLHNPDDPSRPTNSPKTVYQLSPEALSLLRTYGTSAWAASIKKYLIGVKTLTAEYASQRQQQRVPVKLSNGQQLKLSPGGHSSLIRAIIEDFGSRFAPGSALVYAGDTGQKWAYFDEELLHDLEISVDAHGKMPDVILHFPEPDWLLLIEAVTSHGPVDGKRHAELATLFEGARPGLVFVTAFPSRAMMAKHLSEISWETEVWVADAPSHLIHFNGDRFLGPHSN